MVELDIRLAGCSSAASALSVASVVELIASCLPQNEVACTLRQINRFTASVLNNRVQVRLSQPSPARAFAHRWNGRDAMRSLTYEKRQLMMQLTATSGVATNLLLVLERAGCSPTAKTFAAAAAAGHISTCELLRHHDCPLSPAVLEAAARAGRRDAVAWLLDAGCPPGSQLLAAAAGAGHVELCEWLVDERGFSWSPSAAAAAARGGFQALAEQAVGHLGAAMANPEVYGKVLEGAAEGCDLGMLVWLHRTWADAEQRDPPQNANGAVSQLAPPAPPPPQLQQQQRQRLTEKMREEIVAAAAASATPDWDAKVEWLLAKGYPVPQYRVCVRLAPVVGSLPDALTRVTWLVKEKGFKMLLRHLEYSIASSRNLGLLELLEGSAKTPLDDVARAAAAMPNVDWSFVRELHARGAELHGKKWLVRAVRAGCIEAAAWLLETYGDPGVVVVGSSVGQRKFKETGTAQLGPDVYAAGASSGCLDMLMWLAAQGCPWDARTFEEAAGAGCAEQLHWLAARSCPMGDDGAPYVRAARNGDMATLQVLRALGCAWGPPGSVFTAAVTWACELKVLSWLLDAGCSVDWPTAAEAAELRQRPPGVAAWLEQQRQQREESRQRWKRLCVVQ